MSNRNMNPAPREFGYKLKTVRLKIFPNNTGTPTFSTRDNAAGTTARDGVASVVRTAAGKFTITLQDAYRSLIDFQCTYGDSADNVDLYAQRGAVSNLGTSTPVTAVVKLKTGATNTDVAAAADTFITVALTFEDSSV